MAPRPLTAKENSFIDDLMSRMSLAQKIGQLWIITPGGAMLTGETVNTNTEEMIRKGMVGGVFGQFDRHENRARILKIQNHFIQDSPLGIPGIIGHDIIHGYLQNRDHNFPSGPIPLGYNFHTDRLHRMARDAAEQAAADGYNLTFSPVGDYRRDYRDGRIAEGHGTSLYLIKRSVAAMVRGYQGDDPSALDTLATNGKHVDGYGNGIDYTWRDVSAATRLKHLQTFKAMHDAGCLSFMNAFNTNAGVGAHGDIKRYRLFREYWKSYASFFGDYDGVQQLENHGFGDLTTVAALACRAGMSMAMADNSPTRLADAVRQGLLTVEDIDLQCASILRLKLRMGLFDIHSLDGVPKDQRVRVAAKEMRGESETRLKAVIAKTPEYLQSAREDASAACILLKNEKSALPLKRGETVALLGALAGDGIDKRNLPGTWAIGADRPRTVSILEGMKEVMGPDTNIIYAHGANIENDTVVFDRLNCHGETVSMDKRATENIIAEALEACRKADRIVIVAGEACEHAGESSTVSSIRIPETQRKLIEDVAAEFLGKKPIVLVAVGGRPLALGKEALLADALIYSAHGGSMMGPGLADVLSGDTQFSGRLNFDMPYADGPFLQFEDLPGGRPAPSNGSFAINFENERKLNPGEFSGKKGDIVSFALIKDAIDHDILSIIKNRVTKISTSTGKPGQVSSADVPTDGETVIEGKYGALKMYAEGRYEYTVTADDVPENAQETFNFELEQPVIFRKFTVANLLDGPVVPVAPFGYGLALDAKFEYGPMAFNKSVLNGPDDILEVRCRVKNTGTRGALEFPQLYITDREDPEYSQPAKELKGFVEGGVWINPGEEKTVKFNIGTDMLTHFVANTIVDFEEVWNEGIFGVGIGPNALQVKMADVLWKKQPAVVPAVLPRPAMA